MHQYYIPVISYNEISANVNFSLSFNFVDYHLILEMTTTNRIKGFAFGDAVGIIFKYILQIFESEVRICGRY